MKVFKRNAVILTVLLFVCAAVYLNWSYNRGGYEDAGSDMQSQELTSDVAAGQDSETTLEDAGLFYVGQDTDVSAGDSNEGNDSGYVQTDSVAEYFAGVRLSRETARDQAVETLQTVSDTETASQESIDEAMQLIVKYAEWSMLESELESQIKAKGFADCVVYITPERVTVTVASGEEGLSSAGAARITDIVMSGSDYTPEQLKIVEIK